jgi:hypothetical protein
MLYAPATTEIAVAALLEQEVVLMMIKLLLVWCHAAEC